MPCLTLKVVNESKRHRYGRHQVRDQSRFQIRSLHLDVVKQKKAEKIIGKGHLPCGLIGALRAVPARVVAMTARVVAPEAGLPLENAGPLRRLNPRAAGLYPAQIIGGRAASLLQYRRYLRVVREVTLTAGVIATAPTSPTAAAEVIV